MTTTIIEDELALVPLSEFRGDRMSEFRARLAYDGSRSGTSRRWNGDFALLAALDLSRPSGSAITDVPEDVLLECVETVEEEQRGWRLKGDDDQSMFERLDAHFAPAQQLWISRQREQREFGERLAAERREQNEVEARAMAEADRAGWLQRDAAYRARWGSEWDQAA